MRYTSKEDLPHLLNNGLILWENFDVALLELDISQGENTIYHSLGRAPVGYLVLSNLSGGVAEDLSGPTIDELMGDIDTQSDIIDELMVGTMLRRRSFTRAIGEYIDDLVGFIDELAGFIDDLPSSTTTEPETEPDPDEPTTEEEEEEELIGFFGSRITEWTTEKLYLQSSVASERVRLIVL